MKQKIIISEDLKTDLLTAINECGHDRLFVITDDVTEKKCLPLIKDVCEEKHVKKITIKSSDVNKNIETLAYVWRNLGEMGATRHSCVINLGGGMVTDLGGFAASTFKRGLDFINIPTTLLAMVDASVGGKTGVNFNGLKNEIGVFNDSKTVIINTCFLKTLDKDNIRSGYAEMIKHGLISSLSMWEELMRFDIYENNLSGLQRMVADSIKVKEHIVEADPNERGMRKALNLGHTVGHAFESFGMMEKRPILHGYAVAFGLVCELYLSVVKEGFPVEKMRTTVKYIKENYGNFVFTCDDYETLFELMTHDKKNTAGRINFTLLGNIGDIKIDRTASKEDVFESFDFFRECN